MRLIKQSLLAVAILGPVLGLTSGCDTSQNVPLPKVDTPPPLPAQDRSKLSPPKGHSPDVLPQS